MSEIIRTYKDFINNHDFFTEEHVSRFLRNHKTGTDNLGRHRLGEIISNYDNPKVLDVACGSCVNYEVWRGMGVKHRYFGFDLTAKLLDEADKRYGGEISLHRGHAQELSVGLQKENFDIVIIRHFLEHVFNGEYKDIIKQALYLTKNELIIVFFLEPHCGDKDIIEERSSDIEGHPEITYFWNQYSMPKLMEFLVSFGYQIKTEAIYTPGAAHHDFIIRLLK